MKKINYKLYTWYPLTEDEYWVDCDYQNEFPNCQTIVCDAKSGTVFNTIKTWNECSLGWSIMAKCETFKFMIVEKPKFI